MLLTEGEVLVGGKQNRVVNSTILAAGRASYDIPVSCVERGRWNRTQSGFSKGNTAPSSLRSRKIERYFQSAVKCEERSENQGEVWASVDQTLHQTAVRSGTSSLSDAYRELDEELSERVQSVPRIRDARGVVVCAGERVIALELFDSEESFDESAGERRLRCARASRRTRRATRL